MTAVVADAATGTLTAQEWRLRAAAHRDRVEPLLSAVEDRASRGIAHPIEDFLFTYYAYRPNRLRRWHPGVGIALQDAPDLPHRDWAYYRELAGVVALDADAFLAQRGTLVDTVRRLLQATLGRRATFGCFGLHEWAMVYRQRPEEIRHQAWPLRLGADGTDAVVEDRALVCTHFDAFRFFTAEAVPRNATTLTREGQAAYEQGGCLHANMDLYKWAYKLAPATPSELVLDCYELAMEIRYLDMAASPYDFSSIGVRPVRIETAEGRAEYAAAQRSFADRAEVLRRELLAVCERLTGSSLAAATSIGTCP